VIPKAPMLAYHVKQESTKTNKEKPSARRALPASGARRFRQRMILTVKIAKSASIRLQKALILIVFFVQLGHVEKTVSLVVRTRRFAKHVLKANTVEVVMLLLHCAVTALLGSTRITKVKVHACHVFRKFDCFM